MTRLVDESFEGVGYEESWAETIDTNCTLDEDSTPLPGTAPNGAGSYCLKAITENATNRIARALRTVSSDQDISYIRGYVYLDVEGMDNLQKIDTLMLASNSNKFVACPRIAQIAGALKIQFRYYSNGAENVTAFVNFSLDTWHRIEYKYDITNLAWSWKMDGVVQHSGSLQATMNTPRKLLVGIISCTGTAGATMMTDLVAWDDTDWLGEEPGDGIGRLVNGGLVNSGLVGGRLI